MKSKFYISKTKIQNRVAQLSSEISHDYRNKNLHIISVLKGSFFFTVDLIKNLFIPCTIDFLFASSYNDRIISSGHVEIQQNIHVENKDILIVEDIVETGNTINTIFNNIQNYRSVKICSLLNKPRKREFKIDYVGFEIPDIFVIGYGMDWKEKYRDLKFIIKY